MSDKSDIFRIFVEIKRMKHNFSKEISINFNKSTNGDIRMNISSDYSKSPWKSSLHVNDKSISEDLLNLWRSIKTKKLLSMNISFDEIDYYDDMTDIYETPTFFIERGLRKARVGNRQHGSIPKAWSFDLSAKFSETKVITPILEVLRATLGTLFTEAHEKSLTKELRPLLQGKKTYVDYNIN